MLVSLRVWAPIWQCERTVLEVSGDNVAMLTMVSTMRAKGKGTNNIARELALDLADGLFRPAICQRVPGINNVLPDLLSRKYQPGHAFVLPAALTSAIEIKLPVRSPEYYRAA